MSSFVLKIIAIISMLIDHVGVTIYGGFSFFNYLGRFAFPIFCFQLVQGYQHTSNIKKYFSRLLVFAIISQVPFSYFLYLTTGEFHTLNIFFTLTLGLLAIYLFDKCPIKIFGFGFAVACAFIAHYLHMDYGYYGVLLIFALYLLRDNKILMSIAFIVLSIIKFIPTFIATNFYYPNIILCIFTCLALIPILFYNGEQGKKLKYFFYAFYPLHLILLIFVRYLIAI